MLLRYDVVIIGGGTTGLVAAARLSEDNSHIKILVIEAGPDCRGDVNIEAPGLLLNTWGNPKYDWSFWSVPQTQLNGREVPQSRGKVLGGSSAINAAALLFPSSRDFEIWTKLGNKGWTAEDMRPYYRKFLSYCAPSDETRSLMHLDSYMQSDLYGKEGPIKASFAEGFGPFDTVLASVFEDAGISRKVDPITGKFHGLLTPLSSVDQSTRTRSYSTAYFNAAERHENVHLRLNTLVDKMILSTLDDGSLKATGIKIRTSTGEKKEILCGDVVLAAGSLQTPQVLERSGIGAREILDQHGIPTIVDNPGVGENLQDHVWASVSFEVMDGLVTRDAVRDPSVVKTMLDEYVRSSSGPLGSVPLSYGFTPPVDSLGLLSATELEQLVETSVQPRDDDGMIGARRKAQQALLKSVLLDPNECACYFSMFPGQQNINSIGRTSMQQMHAPIRPENFVTLSTGINHPFSRGSVHIASAQPEVYPRIDPAYLSHPFDLELLSRGIQFLDNIVSQPGFGKLIKPGGIRIPDYATEITDPDTSKRVVTDRLWTNYHPACSCPMMPRELGGVVDDRLVVYGTRNVRIIDASVFPVITQGNIQATCYAVAEHACDLIKEDWLNAGRWARSKTVAKI